MSCGMALAKNSRPAGRLERFGFISKIFSAMRVRKKLVLGDFSEVNGLPDLSLRAVNAA